MLLPCLEFVEYLWWDKCLCGDRISIGFENNKSEPTLARLTVVGEALLKRPRIPLLSVVCAEMNT